MELLLPVTEYQSWRGPWRSSGPTHTQVGISSMPSPTSSHLAFKEGERDPGVPYFLNNFSCIKTKFVSWQLRTIDFKLEGTSEAV